MELAPHTRTRLHHRCASPDVAAARQPRERPFVGHCAQRVAALPRADEPLQEALLRRTVLEHGALQRFEGAEELLAPCRPGASRKLSMECCVLRSIRISYKP